MASFPVTQAHLLIHKHTAATREKISLNTFTTYSAANMTHYNTAVQYSAHTMVTQTQYTQVRSMRQTSTSYPTQKPCYPSQECIIGSARKIGRSRNRPHILLNS